MARKYNAPRFFATLLGDVDAAKLLKKKARVFVGYLLDSFRGNQTYKTGSWTLANDKGSIKVTVWKDLLGTRAKAWLYATPTTTEEPIISIRFLVDDYICGVVTGDTIRVTEINDVEIRYIEGITKTLEGTIRDLHDLAPQKLAADLDSKFYTIGDEGILPEGAVGLAQNRRIASGRYTGYMRLLIQLLLGIGVRKAPNYEQWMLDEGALDPVTLNEAELEELEAEEEDLVVSYEPGTLLQISYDYRPQKTHGLTRGTDGKCYIVQISSEGIYAMPLPVTVLSQTEDSRVQMQYLYPELFVEDLSGVGLFDFFGGFPTGAPFPIRDDLEEKVRAGEVLKLADEAECESFYEKVPYSDTMGWAFAPLSNMAVNTCYRQDQRAYVQRGYLYATTWEIRDWEEPEWGDKQTELLNAMEAKGLITEPWHVSKCRRLSDIDAHDIVVSLRVEYDPQDAMDDFLEKEVTPVAEASANMYVMDEGWLYHPAIFRGKLDACADITGHPQYKVALDNFGYNVSFDFSVPDDPDITPIIPDRCDTPIWAAWIKDQLHVVRYFWDSAGAEVIEPHYQSREPCQFVGTWFDITESRDIVQGHFYGSKFDLREQLSITGEKRVTTTGRWAGTQDYMSFPEFFGRCSCTVRDVFAQYDVYTEYDAGTTRYAGIAAPFSDRSIIYTAVADLKKGFYTHTNIGAPVNVGITGFIRFGRLYEFVCHWSLCSCDERDAIIDDGGPNCKLKEMVPMLEQPSCLADFGPPEFPPYMPCVDGYDYTYYGGETNGKLDCALSRVYLDSVPKTEAYNVPTVPVNELKWETRIYGDIQNSGFVVRRGEIAGEDIDIYDISFFPQEISKWWFLTSPTCPPPLYCAFFATANHWGDPVVNYDNDIDPDGNIHYGDFNLMHSGSRAEFVGYVSREVFDHGESII